MAIFLAEDCSENFWLKIRKSCSSGRKKGEGKGRDVIPGRMFHTFGRDVLIKQFDVRPIWNSDPDGKMEFHEMVCAQECKECLHMILNMAVGWMKFGKGKTLVISLCCLSALPRA